MDDTDTKECPKCAEVIKAKASVCRFCNYDFDQEPIVYRRGDWACNACGCLDKPKNYLPGAFWIEFLLWFIGWWCFFVPGVVYTLWRHCCKFKGCRNCRSKQIMPVEKVL